MQVTRWLGTRVIRRAAAVLPGAILIALAGVDASWSAVTIRASRTELLYSAELDPDCSELFALADAVLPFNVARLEAVVDNIPSGRPVRYRWSIKKGDEGVFAANLDLGPDEQNAAVAGMCAEFGNQCLLTEERLRLYNEPKILWLGPTCDVLPNNTSRVFPGDTTRVRVKVTAGRRRLGRATITLGWGRDGSVQTFLQDVRGNFDDGIGKPLVNVPAVTPIGVNLIPPTDAPPGGVDRFKYVTTSDTLEIPPGCPPIPQFDSCAELDVFAAGMGFVTTSAIFTDESAVCDKIKFFTGPCAAKPRLEVIRRPKRTQYDPDSPQTGTVDLTVRLHNDSQREGNLLPCNFLLRGAGVLTCSGELKLGNLTETMNETFDLPRCSQTATRGCLVDADCSPAACSDCQPNEVCLTTPHCSQTFTQACNFDDDCRTPQCPTCKESETCVRVLTPQGPGILVDGADVFIPVGRFADLLTENVRLRNELFDPARMLDTWTANVFIPRISDSQEVRYRIRPRPRLSP